MGLGRKFALDRVTHLQFVVATHQQHQIPPHSSYVAPAEPQAVDLTHTMLKIATIHTFFTPHGLHAHACAGTARPHPTDLRTTRRPGLESPTNLSLHGHKRRAGSHRTVYCHRVHQCLPRGLIVPTRPTPTGTSIIPGLSARHPLSSHSSHGWPAHRPCCQTRAA